MPWYAARSPSVASQRRGFRLRPDGPLPLRVRRVIDPLSSRTPSSWAAARALAVIGLLIQRSGRSRADGPEHPRG
jgi:hypothetical protein